MNNQAEAIIGLIKFSQVCIAVFIFLVAVIISHFVRLSKGRLQKQFPDFKLSIEQVATVIRFMVLLIGGAISIFAIFGFSNEVMLAVGGSMAVAIGFGLKDIAAAILAGFFILFERPFQVGDRIAFGNTYGDVISIGLRSTKIRTLDDSTVTISNNKFTDESVLSTNSGALDMMTQLDFFVHHEADIDLVKKLVRESVIASRYVFLQKPIVVLFSDVLVERFFCLRVRVKAYIIDTQYEKPFESDLTQRLHRAFKQNEVKYPIATV